MKCTSYQFLIIATVYFTASGEVSELVDEPDLGSGAERRVGSSPSFPTTAILNLSLIIR